MNCTFRQYKVYANIHWGSVVRGVKRQWGGQNRQFLVISVAISSEPLESKPIILCGISFPLTLKCLTLNDLEMPFYAKICFHYWFHYIFLPCFWRQLCENE